VLEGKRVVMNTLIGQVNLGQLGYAQFAVGAAALGKSPFEGEKFGRLLVTCNRCNNESLQLQGSSWAPHHL
jgi:hypothetical protein